MKKIDNQDEFINKNILYEMKDTVSNTKKIKAVDFLSPKRFDILAKYLYVKFFINKIDSNFGLNIYLSHIDSFNGFVEMMNQKKLVKMNLYQLLTR